MMDEELLAMEEELICGELEDETHMFSDASLTLSGRMESLTLSGRVDNGTRDRVPLFLGFFMEDIITSSQKVSFLRCSEEGKSLLCSSFNPSLSFLRMPTKRIVGSSNGLLLICSDPSKENSCYVVCNPVTREFKSLPRPHKVYPFAALSFICKRDNDCASLDRIDYEVVRVGVPYWYTYCTTYEVETFSSLSGEWNRSQLVSALPFELYNDRPAFVLDDVIYWQDMREFLLAYDRSKPEGQENIQQLKLPKDDQAVTYHDGLSLCEGKIYYARSSYSDHIELWVLLDYERAEWVLKHKVSLTEIKRMNPNLPRLFSLPATGHVHPYKSNLLFLDSPETSYWYDCESGKLHEVASNAFFGCRHFIYEWPCAPNPTHDGCQIHSRI